MIYDDPQRASRLAQHRREELDLLERAQREARPRSEAPDAELDPRPRRPLLSIRT